MYKPRHFAPWELLPDCSGDETWESLDPVLRAELDDHMLETADGVRDLLGAFTVNNYKLGGSRHYCGLRDKRCPQYSATSQHTKGKAFDGHFKVIDQARAAAVSVAKAAKKTQREQGDAGLAAAIQMADVLREKIRDAVAAGKLPYLGRIELGVSWIHCDTAPRRNGKVVEFDA